MAEISAKIKGSTELMKQFYSNLCDVPELEDQRRVTMYMESTESRSPTRAFELNSLYLLHAVLYRHHSEIVSTTDNPLTAILRDLGNMPDQLSADQNKQVGVGGKTEGTRGRTPAHTLLLLLLLLAYARLAPPSLPSPPLSSPPLHENRACGACTLARAPSPPSPRTHGGHRPCPTLPHICAPPLHPPLAIASPRAVTMRPV